MRLTDWIVAKVNAVPKITIPALPFSALKLLRDADGHVSFDLAAVSAIEQASGLPDGELMRQHEDVLAEIITRWYSAHRAAGGEPDPTAEDLLAEVRAEDARGGGYSHRPGRA